MGRVIFAVMLILVVLMTFFSFWYFKDMYEILPVAEQPNYPQVNIEDWNVYSDGEKRFSVLLPSMPQHAAEVKEDESTGHNKKYEVYSAEQPNGTVYIVLAITYQEPLDGAQQEEELNSVVNKLMKGNENNQLKMRANSEFLGHEALDVLIANQQHEVMAKAFFVDDETLYVLNSVARSDVFNPNEFQFFVNSFHLLNGAQEPDVPATPFFQSSVQMYHWSES